MPKKRSQSDKRPQHPDHQEQEEDLIDFSTDANTDKSIHVPKRSSKNTTSHPTPRKQADEWPSTKVSAMAHEKALLDEPIAESDQAYMRHEESEERVQVTLKRKRSGRKGKQSTYDLTPFLSY
jgi:hypothetical protein